LPLPLIVDQMLVTLDKRLACKVNVKIVQHMREHKTSLKEHKLERGVVKINVQTTEKRLQRMEHAKCVMIS